MAARAAASRGFAERSPLVSVCELSLDSVEVEDKLDEDAESEDDALDWCAVGSPGSVDVGVGFVGPTESTGEVVAPPEGPATPGD